ncbi:hypothetical protein PRIPAC_84087 [Pristionchus pacificus]|uniref:Uncharacterized protein n=1 Tax=Pristionchus pacificus TaxID=54126 RepID=A0A2A6BS01_PRIPA|nr:hypothetical protein PRIPAC_84087 [Pristionchus pacificus]|eukprot:PDM68694.1 hypothetical protein PRIPAC_46996 [Pristionchus pacificus]
MLSKFEPLYSSLQSHLTSLKDLLTSTEDEITKLLSAATSDEIITLSASISKGVDDIQSIMYDYREITSSIKDGIEEMDDDAQKTAEQMEYDSKMESNDGGTGLSLNPVRLSSTVSKLESRFARCLDTASMRISAIERILKSNPSPPPAQPSVPTQSTHDGDTSPALSNESTIVIQSLLERINTLESNSTVHKPNLSLPPIRLECFDGSNITNWPAYKYQLDELILNNPSLNEVEKAFHVRSSLKGTALALVSSIPTHKDFLDKIIKRLELEYSRSKKITLYVMPFIMEVILM